MSWFRFSFFLNSLLWLFHLIIHHHQRGKYSILFYMYVCEGGPGHVCECEMCVTLCYISLFNCQLQYIRMCVCVEYCRCGRCWCVVDEWMSMDKNEFDVHARNWIVLVSCMVRFKILHVRSHRVQEYNNFHIQWNKHFDKIISEAIDSINTIRRKCHTHNVITITQNWQNASFLRMCVCVNWIFD